MEILYCSLGTLVVGAVAGYIYGAKREYKGKHKGPVWKVILGKH